MSSAVLDQGDEITRRWTGCLGSIHARQRLAIEEAHEAKIFERRPNSFGLKNLYSIHSVIKNGLRLVGLHNRGQRNAARVQVKTNRIVSARLPAAFDGFRILHLSDLHADISRPAMARVGELVADLDYDVCVLTGDYRGKTFGSFTASLEVTENVVSKVRSKSYGVLGNHDSIRMVPGLEDMGVHMLLNENVALERGEARIYLAEIDDAHFYRLDNIEKAADGVPDEAFAILLSHTPEVFRQAAHAGFNICSPDIPTGADLPPGFDPNHVAFDPTQALWIRRVGLRRNGRLYLRGVRVEPDCRTSELPSRNHRARTSSTGSLMVFAQERRGGLFCQLRCRGNYGDPAIWSILVL